MSDQFKEPPTIWENEQFRAAFAGAVVLALWCFVILGAIALDKFMR